MNLTTWCFINLHVHVGYFHSALGQLVVTCSNLMHPLPLAHMNNVLTLIYEPIWWLVSQTIFHTKMPSHILHKCIRSTSNVSVKTVIPSIIPYVSTCKSCVYYSHNVKSPWKKYESIEVMATKDQLQQTGHVVCTAADTNISTQIMSTGCYKHSSWSEETIRWRVRSCTLLYMHIKAAKPYCMYIIGFDSV